MKKISIITLTWNGSGVLEKLYNSILPALEEFNWIWGIRDNASKDNTVEIVNSWNNDRIKCFAYKNNLQNYAQGNNWTYDQIKSDNDDYVMLLNNDIIFIDPSSIRKMTNILDNDLEVGIVGCKLNYESNPKLIQHTGVLFHQYNIGTPYHFRGREAENKRDRENRYFPIVTAAVMIIRADLFKEVGMLDERYHWCWEDSDLCMKIGELGKKIVCCGQTSILHSESLTLRINPTNKMYFNQNLKLFVDKWSSKIDKSLVKKYTEDSSFALYK